ncbi:hypothetical protein LWI28_004168 [Acer negundo]|uniref:Endoplasmic reticulum transmembrane protein n=1 Tax=Acer negundo TaxID=4023 RepID=A0AAD5NWC3_ACENE|nr:hypothetical protein LWI28_004168 [Acer negundo]KAK4850672.1 hypothetical protein QYF36_008857 [Acer negundo]
MALILSLMFRTPLRKLVILGIDKLKQGKGPLIAKTVAVTMLVVFSSIVYGAMEIGSREGGAVNSTDEVLMANLMLESSLMGFSLFLAMMTDRLHYYIKELYSTRKELENAIQLINKDREEDRKISEAMEETKETKDYPLKLKTKDRSY